MDLISLICFIFLVGMAVFLLFGRLGWKMLCWLKGSRISYYLSDGSVIGNFIGTNFRGLGRPVIEVSRGLFRRRSSIYGSNAENWRIVRTNFVDVGLSFPSNSVWLEDRKGLSAGTALKLINTHPSL